MPKWEVKEPLDYSATGDDIDSASQKLIATLQDVYDKLNRLRTMDADALHAASDAVPFSFKIDTSIEPPAILIRNGANDDYIQIGSVAEKMGITASDMGAITGNGVKKLSLGAEQDLPATAETYDMYFAYDTGRLYMFLTGAWRVFLSLRFGDLLGVGDAVIERDEVAANGANKIPRLNEVGQGAFDITGSAAKIGDKNLYLPELLDGGVLVYNATRERWEVAPRDDITQNDVSTTGEANKIVKADANGAIANDTKGSAAKIATKTIDVSNLQDGDVLVYDATHGTFINRQGAVVNAQGVVEANVSGSAAKWGGKTIQTVNMVDGQILVWSEANQAFINRNQSAVGNARALSLRQDGVELANYNGDDYRAVNIITPHLRVASQTYTVGQTCFSSNMASTYYLECVTAGVTQAVEPDFSSAAIGDVVADGGAEWKVCGYVNTEVTDALDDRVTTTEGDITTIQTQLDNNNRKPTTTYELKDIRYYSGLPVGWYLECTTAGETSASDITLPSPIVENATVTDGTVVWKIRKISSADMPFNGITNNSIYRGKDITDYFESGQMSADMAIGKWDNIFVGDFITKSVTINGVTYADVKWIVMHINYHLHCGDTETTENHVVLMPEEQLGSRQMNPTHTTAGGYVGSAMWTVHIPLVVAGIEAAFGADHVLAHRELLTNAMNGDLISANWTAARGATTGWAWVTAKANLATEEMVYGAPIWSSSAHDSSGDTMQLAAFKLNRGLISSKRYWWWLRSVAHSSSFCFAADGGSATLYVAARSGGVRPYFLLR